MNSWDFSGSRLKLSRAICHLDELDTRLLDWLKSEPYLIAIEKNIQTGDKSFKFDIIKSIPYDIPVIIGDAVHNLRSALDFIVVEIFRKAGLSLAHVYFPFRKNRDDLQYAMEKSGLQAASPIVADIIINQIQPYEAGDIFLWSLNEMSNTDKHRLLIPTIFRTHAQVPLYYNEQIGTIPVHFVVDSNDSIELPIVENAALDIKIQGDITKTQQIFFDEPIVKELPFLDIPQLLRYVAGLINRYTTIFEGL